MSVQYRRGRRCVPFRAAQEGKGYSLNDINKRILSGGPCARNQAICTAIQCKHHAQTTRSAQPILLVGVFDKCETRLGEALGILRASSVAIRTNAPPSAKALLDYVRQHVPPVESEWTELLKEVQAGRYQDTKINSVETSVGPKKQKRQKTE